jgi:dipeptidyl aminopeptidase/acylaminoacyl peptidase
MSGPRSFVPGSVLALALLLVPATPAHAQKPVVMPADYGRYENLGPGTLSADGRWLAFGISRVNESVEVRLRSLERDTTLVLAHATAPAFTPDSHWLVYSIGVSPPERERLERERKPIQNRLGILDLRTLATIEIERVASFALSRDGHYVAMRGYAPEGRTTDAVDLLVRELESGVTTAFGNVTSFAWSDVGPQLAMTVATESGSGNGVQLFDAASTMVRVLDSSPVRYRGLQWRRNADDLAVLRAQPDTTFRDTTHTILAWRGVQALARPVTFEPAVAGGFPRDLRIAESGALAWSEDGAMLYFGLRPREPVPPKNGAKPDSIKTSDVQVWHSRDFRIFPMQRSQEQGDLRRVLLAAWNLADGRFVQVGTDLQENATVVKGGRLATETSVEPYRFAAMFGRQWNDIYLTDLMTGQRRKLLEKVRYFQGGSTTGRWLLWFQGDDWWTYDTQTGARTNITQNIQSGFANTAYDYPVEQYPSYGIAGWTTGDRALLVYDRYDIWSVAPDGSSARRLTDGARDSTVHRYIRLRRDEEAIDMTRPLLLSLTGEWTKKSGWARLRAGQAPERLVFEDRSLTRLARADSADIYVFVREDYDDSPDWFAAGPRLADARQVSETNPFQKDVAWGRSELIEYTSQTGRRLQGSLHYPANYQPGTRYPMIVYQYEILSNTVHRYVTPSERSYYNIAVFNSLGYFVLQPDIVYRPRDPGRSAVEAIVPAVQSVVDRGLVDAARVGLVGHSWGGYQATYVPTQTNIFAASVAGAPITNYLSFMGAIHWNGGLPETGHWETGQARMDVPYWEDFEAHVRNSPAAFIDKLQTPMLMEFGDADGTVDWHQGVEFYNFARRAGKQNFVLLVYPGEDHGLRKKENQIDYERRIIQWFGHWLKGEPAPKWMKDGMTFMERKAVLDGGGARQP